MNIGMSDIILYDRSRNQNNGTFSNVSWVQLPSGLFVMSFNATTSYVEIPDSPTMRMTQGGTILCWIKANSLGETAGTIILKGTDSIATNGYGFSLTTLNRIYAKINGGTSLVSSNDAVPYSVYKMVAFTFSGAGRKLWVNAVDVTNTGGSETALPPDVSGAVRIGNRAGGTDRTFDGQIALLRMWTRPLSATELARIFTSERGLFGV